MEDQKNIFDNRIKHFRKMSGYTQIQMAKLINIASPQITKWENGYTVPSFLTVCNMASVLGVSVDVFDVNKELTIKL